MRRARHDARDPEGAEVDAGARDEPGVMREVGKGLRGDVDTGARDEPVASQAPRAPRSAGPIVYMNGALVPADEARLSPFDRGLLYGDGVFETVRAYDGLPFALERHVDRMLRSLIWLRIDIAESSQDLCDAVGQVIDANGVGDAVVRITITRGAVDTPLGLPASAAPTRLIHVRELRVPTADQYRVGVPVIVASEPLAGPVSARCHKTLNYLGSLFAKQEARERGAFEAIVCTVAGSVIEGASSNVFVARDGGVVTPQLTDGVLPGITRAICLELLREAGVRCEERSVTLAEVRDSDELWLTNSVAEIVPVVSLDGRSIGEGVPGPITREVAAAYRRRVATDGAR